MNPIIEHALTKIWTNPKQDYQAIVRPAQVTPSYGAVNRFHYSYREYGLPEDGVKFHVYTYGGYWIENLNVKINYEENGKVPTEVFKKLMGRKTSRRVLKTWNEDFVDEDNGEVVSIERNEIIVDKNTIIDRDVLDLIFDVQAKSVFIHKF